MKKMTFRLKGMPVATRWVVASVRCASRFADACEWLLREMCFELRSAFVFLARLTLDLLLVSPIRFADQAADRRRSNREILRGLPATTRTVLSVIFIWPVVLFRYIAFIVLASLWIRFAPDVYQQFRSAVLRAETVPKKKRTPSSRQAANWLSDFDDVRARVSELSE